MGAWDSLIVELIKKFGSWFSTARNSSYLQETLPFVCSVCHMDFVDHLRRYNCQTCGCVMCGKCLQGYKSVITVTVNCMDSDKKAGAFIKSCKVCAEGDLHLANQKMSSGKVHPSVSLRKSLEPYTLLLAGGTGRREGDISGQQTPRDHFSGTVDACDNCSSPNTGSSAASLSGHPSPVSVSESSCRSDEEESEVSRKYFLSPTSEYYQNSRDIDFSSFRARIDFYNSKSVGSSPLDSPSRINFSSYSVGHSVQHDQGRSLEFHTNGLSYQEIRTVLEKPDSRTNFSEDTDDSSSDLCTSRDPGAQKSLDFENNGLIWFPPPPEDEQREAENNFFCYDDEDDEIGESGGIFSSSNSLQDSFITKGKRNEDEPIRTGVQGHFKALVAELFKGEGIESSEDWLPIIAELALQAANFIKPDTTRGGSMDPVDYVKVKCIATGSPNDSTLVRGIVCTKNIKHKRMNSQYAKPRLLLLGGALEYHRTPNQLASIDALLQQEIDHLKMIVSRIEAHRPNVLLVEKSVSSYAQDYLLAKEISLVLNVKRSLLERIARCSGATITPSLDKIANARLGHCELFRLEKTNELHEIANQGNRKLSRTLMYFEGCPRRSGCTVVLKGACRKELKKMKRVVQYSVFAAYHLSLETSFLADEGASLPKTTLRPSFSVPARMCSESVISVNNCTPPDFPLLEDGSTCLSSEVSASELSTEMSFHDDVSPRFADYEVQSDSLGLCTGEPIRTEGQKLFLLEENVNVFSSAICKDSPYELQLPTKGDEISLNSAKPGDSNESETRSAYFTSADSHQSILVSFSSRCVVKGTVCERSRLLRIKFYGSFDKPLGRYIHEDLFTQETFCRSCDERVEAHVRCFTHQKGSLTINVKRLPNVKLPGEQDGKIWMWHRCLKCAHIDGIPPATRRVIMSDAAWGLSFGKFLELSFSNHATANRVAPCGHSLQKDCLRYYGCGSMVAFFRYSPIDILCVRLPPSVLEFNSQIQQEWITREAAELIRKCDFLYSEIRNILDNIKGRYKCTSRVPGANNLSSDILELEDLLEQERHHNNAVLQGMLDTLELNRFRRNLLIDSQIWDCRLCSLDSSLRSASSTLKANSTEMKDFKKEMSYKVDGPVLESLSLLQNQSPAGEFGIMNRTEVDLSDEETSVAMEVSLTSSSCNAEAEIPLKEEIAACLSTEEGIFSSLASLSDRIDLAWTGNIQSQADGFLKTSICQPKQSGDSSTKRMMPPRVFSFDSATRAEEKAKREFPPSAMYLSALRSFHASGEYRNMVRDPVADISRSHPLVLSPDGRVAKPTPLIIYSAAYLTDGARLLLPQTGSRNVVVAVYDNEPSSAIAYALSSKEHEDWISGKHCDCNGTPNFSRETSIVSAGSFSSLEMGFVHVGGYGPEEVSLKPKKSPHLRITFEDESLIGGDKMKFSVTCYFAKQFDSLRKKCCPDEVDFISSLCRCEKWRAQGGKSNVYFARSLDERFIIKQVTKTELDSFEEFAPDYFKYLTESLSSRGPTCLAKVLGIYQVTTQNLQGGKESKMDLIVMENLFYNRKISRIYDLKGSARSRYNSDTTGANKVLLDMNLLETLRTSPIFLGSEAKRSLERAVWNDTSFLASVDVMDYSLLVGVDDDRKELVIGIIDFMRQYTWDKHLETWVKASGILGGPKNASPTIISPKQYKRRFRKAMTKYFHTVPDQ
uniref:1-phosphatidylinositol-3-phosphate 5-kinase n=2 Tax=Kalanchoe fedtschenkoi TaxID=63787 RepID=A0A7N0UCP9_KALFE